ncbi:MAG TPA: four helix bundle protein [Candidatus Paceibacterota bacterium]
MQKPASTLSLVNSSILQCIKEGYLLWLSIVPHIAKSTRYTLGVRIENTFLDVLEKTYTAYFTRKETKSEKVAECIRTLDILKYLISVAWEGKCVGNKQFEDIALKLEEAGRRFGAWKKSLENPEKKNRAV